MTAIISTRSTVNGVGVDRNRVKPFVPSASSGLHSDVLIDGNRHIHSSLGIDHVDGRLNISSLCSRQWCSGV